MKRTFVLGLAVFGLVLALFAQNTPSPTPSVAAPAGLRQLVPTRGITSPIPFFITQTNTNSFIITRTNTLGAGELPPGTYLATPYTARVIIPAPVDQGSIYSPTTNYTIVMPVIRPEVQLVPVK